MKMRSQLGGSPPARPPGPRAPRIRWVRAPRGQEWSLIIKTLMTLTTAAIAIFAVRSMAHALQVLNQSINQ